MSSTPPPAVPPHTPSATGISAVTWVMMLSLSVIWGGSFLFGRVAVAHMPPFTLVAVRVLLGTMTLAAILLVTRTAFPKGRTTGSLCWAWVSSTTPFPSA